MDLMDKLNELGNTFDSFKKTNEQRETEIKKFGAATALTEEKLAKTEKQMQTLELQIEEMKTALNRSAQDSVVDEKGDKKTAEYKNAISQYMKKGTEVPAELQDWAKKAMSVDSDDDGGFFVSPQMSSEIVTKIFESSPIRQLASVQTISTDALEIVEDLDEAGSGWVGETEARPETGTQSIKKIVIPVHELYANPKATQKLLDDAAVNVEAWLAGKVADKFSRDEATAFMSGTGHNKPKGILNYGSGDGFGLIQRQLTATNSAIAADDLISLQALLKEGYQLNASWMINRLLIAAIRKLKDVTSGQYIWQPGLTAGSPNQLLGRPVYMAADLPTAFGASNDLIVYGDIKAGYQIVDRIGIRTLRDPFTAKPYVLFYTTKRVGGGVKNFEAIKVLRGNT